MTSAAHRSRRLRVAGLGIFLGLTLSAVAAPAGTLAAGEVRVTLTNPGCDLTFVGLPNTDYTVDLMRNGISRATATPPTTDGTGASSIQCFDWQRLPPNDGIRSLDVLTFARAGGTTRNITIPPLNLTFNRAVDSITGTTSPLLSGKFDSGRVNFCPTPGYQCTVYNTRPNAGSGSFTVQIGDRDLRGGDVLELAATYGTAELGDKVSFIRYVPYVQVERGSAVVQGMAKPLSVVRIKFLNADGVQVAGGAKAAGADGYFSITVKKSGVAYPLKNGLRVMTNLQGVVRGFNGLSLDLSEAASGVVSGNCYPGQPYRLVVTDPVDAFNVSDRTGVADGGDLRQDGLLGGSVPSGARVILNCSDKDGDVFHMEDTVP